MRAQPGVFGVLGRGVRVLAGLRRDYEPALWRREARAQTVALLTGHRAGRSAGRDHDGIPAHSYRSRSGAPPLWIRHGTGDAAVWGEVNLRAAYAGPWELPQHLRVLDLGGHVGYFARWALEHWPVTSLVSLEPDPGNAEVLQRNLQALGDARWSLVHAAAATAEGTASFAGGRGSGSALTAYGEVTVPTIDALVMLAQCDLAKIDIEGGEWPILGDPRFAACSPPMLVLEHHPAVGVKRPAAQARSRLEACGYEVVDGHREAPGVGVLWGRRIA